MNLQVETFGEEAKTFTAQEINIMGDDGRSAYSITMSEDGVLEVSSGSSSVKINGGPMKDAGLIIEPTACNVVKVSRKDRK
jgi:hypothetical protein